MTHFRLTAAVVMVAVLGRAAVQGWRDQAVERKRAAYFAANGVTVMPGTKDLSRRTVDNMRKQGLLT